MKKTILIISLTIISYYAKAQLQVGGGFTYGQTTGLPGFTVKAEKQLSEKWSLSPEFNFFFARGSVLRGEPRLSAGNVSEMYAINLDFHKHVTIKYVDNLGACLIMGVNVAFPVYVSEFQSVGGRTFETRDTQSGASLNIGLGAEYQIKENLDLYYEAKGMLLGNADQLILTLGVLISI